MTATRNEQTTVRTTQEARPEVRSRIRTTPLLPADAAPADAAGLRAELQASPKGSKLPLYELKMTPTDLRQLEQNPYSNDTYPATFVANGVVFEKVRVRHRGQWARTWPKKPWKLFFPRDHLFEGQHCLNLNSAWRDPAFIREPLAFHVYAACGVPASRARMIRLHVNGQFHGLYVEVEQPDKAFLARQDLKGAAVFKATSRSNRSDERDLGNEAFYSSHYERQTRKEEGFAGLQAFCQELARATNTLEFFTRRVEVEEYVNYLAATVLVQNWDCYNKNHYLLQDERGSQKWLVVPWDLDRTFGDHGHDYFGEAQLPVLFGTRQVPGNTGWNRLADRFLSEPALRARFLDRLEQLLKTEFTPEKLFPVVDRLEAEVTLEAPLDRRRWPAVWEDLHSGVSSVKHYIERRRAFVAEEVTRLRREPAVPPPFRQQTR